MLKTAKKRLPESLCLIALLVSLVFGQACRKGRAPAESAAGAGGDYSCLFRSGRDTLTAKEAGVVVLPLRLKNAGRAAWSSQDSPPTLLSFHLLSAKGEVIRWDNARQALPRAVKPGEACSITARVKAPLEVGRYIVEFDLVREGVAWFAAKGSKTLRVELKVGPREWPEDRFSLGLGEGPYTKFDSNRLELEKLQKLIRITLDTDELTFQGETGEVSGFQGGAGYPQIWLRDSNTILPASRCYYGQEQVKSWLVEHLAHQGTDGSLQDWIDASGMTGKNTVESDQEASAVLAAAQVCGLVGRSWLTDKVGTRTVIERLEAALQYLLTDRLDERTGLIKSGHTIDWGDVDIEDADTRAIQVDERTHWVAGIYSQSLFYGAAQALSRMFEGLGQKEKALFWSVRAESVRRNAVKGLWQDRKGFFRVHIHLEPRLSHPLDEDSLFPMGGNVWAILTGLADEARSRSILREALARRKPPLQAGAVLLPPYPAGLFKHPQVDEPYEYQNGGQWDWFGGLLVLALYRNGYSRQATDDLLRLVRKDVANGGLFEWDDFQGRGRGSDHYAGSAGSLARALFEGYFGIVLSRDSLSLEPRLGSDASRVHVYLPAADLYAAYDYRPGADGRSLRFDYGSDFRGRGRVRIRLPWPSPASESLRRTAADYEVRLDGVPAVFQLTRVNEDEYIGLETDFRDHQLTIRLSSPGRAAGRRERPRD